MSYPALSVASLGSILHDLNTEVQIIHHSKQVPPLQSQSLIDAFSPSVLRVIMIVYSQCYSLYLLKEEDGEGLENDVVFRDGIVIPEIITILEIVHSLLASTEFRMALYNADPIQYVKNLAYFRTTTLSPQFILQDEQ